MELFFTGRSFRRVSSNCVFQESVCRCSDTGQPVQFQLHVEAGLLRAVAVRDRAPRHGTQAPAAGLVFEAGKTLQQFAVAQAVDDAGVGIPALADRPGSRDLGLFERIALCAIAEVQDALAVRPVLQAGTASARCGCLRDSIAARLRRSSSCRPDSETCAMKSECRASPAARPAAPRAAVRSSKPGRCSPRGTARRCRQLNSRRGESERDLVGVVDAIGADVAIGAEQLHQVQVGQAGVEQRQFGSGRETACTDRARAAPASCGAGRASRRCVRTPGRHRATRTAASGSASRRCPAPGSSSEYCV